MATLIVSYEKNSDKKQFEKENKKLLDEYKIIYVNNRDIHGVRLDLLPGNL